MGDILAFPRQSTGMARRALQGRGHSDPQCCEDEITVSMAVRSPMEKALLFSLASLEAARASLAQKVKRLPHGEIRERLLQQQSALVVMIYHVKRLLAECES